MATLTINIPTDAVVTVNYTKVDCERCGREFDTSHGVKNHHRACTGEIITDSIRKQVWVNAVKRFTNVTCYCCNKAVFEEQFVCVRLKSEKLPGEDLYAPSNQRPVCGKCFISMKGRDIYTYMMETDKYIPGDLAEMFPEDTAANLMHDYEDLYDDLAFKITKMGPQVYESFMKYVRAESYFKDLLDAKLYESLTLDILKTVITRYLKHTKS